MPAKPSGEIKTRIVHMPQKNGDIYVVERQTIYIPEKKYNKVISSRLIAKIPKGEKIPVQTRAKGNSKRKNGIKTQKLSAQRLHVGMMDIIDHIGTVSGIDAGVYGSTDIGTAQKIISLARYLLATDGQSLPGILTWQYNHPLPYAQGLSETIYHSLFVQVGRDETLQQSFFKSRCEGLGKMSALAYDSTTVSTYSGNQIEARYGYNKADDGLKTVKLLTLYSIDARQPIAFTKQPGNIPDVLTVKNSLKQLSALGLDAAEIITDNGYYSEQNLAEMLCAGYNFLTLVKTSVKWVKKEIDGHMGEFTSIGSTCPFDPSIHGITIKLMRTFTKERKYSSGKKGLSKGDREAFDRRIYLHVYFSLSRQNQDRMAFEADLVQLKSVLESGIPIEELPEKSRNKAKKYLAIRQWGSKVSVAFNDKACQAAYRYHGFFALVSNKEKETFECLRKYRKRVTIESFFETEKQHADGARIRVWDTDTLRGRMFVRFVALCYYEYYSNEIRKLKQLLGEPNGDASHDTKENLDDEKALKSWLQNTPIYLQLQWFDTVETTTVSSELRSKRWSTEVTARDNMFLDKLGILTT